MGGRKLAALTSATMTVGLWLAAAGAGTAHARFCLPTPLMPCAIVLPSPPPPPPAQCADGLDNDRDGAVDAPFDAGCRDEHDDVESDDVAPDIGGDASVDVDPDAVGKLFGLNGPMGHVTLSVVQEADLLQQLGASLRRLTVQWDGKQLAPGAPLVGMSALDAQVRALRARGIRPIFTFLRAPKWAACSTTDLKCQLATSPQAANRPPSADHVGDFGAFVESVAVRYNSGEFAGLAPVVETWNEPNLSRYWTSASFPQPSRMSDMQCAAYSGVRGNASLRDVLVLSAGLLGLEDIDVRNTRTEAGLLDYLQAIFERQRSEGHARCWDALAFHDYSGASVDGTGSRSARVFRIVRNLQRRYGHEAPLWITETGATTGDAEGNDAAGGLTAVSATEQCRQIHTALNEYLTTSDVAAVVAHKALEGGAGDEHGFGWLRAVDPPEPKPVWDRHLARLQGGGSGC